MVIRCTCPFQHLYNAFVCFHFLSYCLVSNSVYPRYSGRLSRFYFGYQKPYSIMLLRMPLYSSRFILLETFLDQSTEFCSCFSFTPFLVCNFYPQVYVLLGSILVGDP